MNIIEEIKKLKSKKGFKESVGMVLIHNGVVRGRSKSGKKVDYIEVETDEEKVKKIKKEALREGIFKVIIKTINGKLYPGDDIMFIIVAGNYRENVKKTLAETLEKIKTTAVKKEEFLL